MSWHAAATHYYRQTGEGTVASSWLRILAFVQSQRRVSGARTSSMDTDGALRHRSGHGTTSEACVSENTKNFLVVGCGEPGGETGGGGAASGAVI